MTDQNLVSVIIPSLNSGRFIEKTLASVLSQTHRNVEIIVVDNNSQDNTRNIISEMGMGNKRFRPILLDTVNRAGPTRNIGIQAAQGRYLAFIDSDDIWNPDKLEKQITFMDRQGVAFSFTGYEVIDESDAHICSIPKMPIKLEYRDFLKNTCIATSSVMIDRSIVPNFQFMDRPISEDYPTWLNLLKNGHQAAGLSGEFLRYRVVSSSLSSRKAKAARLIWRIFREEEKLSLPQATYCFSCYACRAAIKNLKMKRHRAK